MAQVVMLVHEENKRFGASFPDFPGCTTAAGDLDNLLTKANEALAFHVAGMIEDGRQLPPIRSLTELRADPQFREDASDAILVTLVPVELPSKVLRVNITLDENTLGLIDRAAEASGETRSGFLARAAKERIARSRQAGA